MCARHDALGPVVGARLVGNAVLEDPRVGGGGVAALAARQNDFEKRHEGRRWLVRVAWAHSEGGKQDASTHPWVWLAVTQLTRTCFEGWMSKKVALRRILMRSARADVVPWAQQLRGRWKRWRGGRDARMSTAAAVLRKTGTAHGPWRTFRSTGECAGC